MFSLREKEKRSILCLPIKREYKISLKDLGFYNAAKNISMTSYPCWESFYAREYY